METQYTQLLNNIKVKDSIQIQINSSFLQSNFELIKQCLRKIATLKSEVAKQSKINKDIIEKFTYMQKDLAALNTKNQKVQNRVANLQKKQFLDDVYKKIHELHQKQQATKSNDMGNFEELIKKIEQVNKFVKVNNFEDYKTEVKTNFKEIPLIRQDMQRYVQNVSFKNFKLEMDTDFSKVNKQIMQINDQSSQLKINIDKVKNNLQNTITNVNQHSNMIKQINFGQVQSKLKKFKQQINCSVQDLAKKIKKIVSTTQLNQLERTIVTKIDQYILNNLMHRIADKNQIKNALVFLQNRINLSIAPPPQPKQQDADSLFATKQWICAACTTNLGKYEGKLNKFKPWAVFPCRQLSPQKSGGYGYLTYLDKLSSNKGLSLDDTNLERLNDTGVTFRKQNLRHSFSKPTAMMNSFGQVGDSFPSLAGEYFKSFNEIFNSKGKQKQRSKQDEQGRRKLKSAAKGQRSFRVKKDSGDGSKKEI